MNPTPRTRGRRPRDPRHRGQDGPAAPGTVEATIVPRQKSPRDSGPPLYASAPGSGTATGRAAPDALDDPDPLRAADAA